MHNYASILKGKGISPANFLEIGSRDGDDASTFANCFSPIPVSVYIIEASPTSYANIKRSYPRYDVSNLALSNRVGPTDFFNILGDNILVRGMSSLMNREHGYDPAITEKITVSCDTGERFLKDKGISQIDACKIDVEGHAYEVLEGFGNDLARIKSMHLEAEIHATWVGQKLFSDCSALLKDFGFSQVYYTEYNQPYTQCDSIWIHNSAL